MNSPTPFEQQIANTIEKTYRTEQIEMPDGTAFPIKHHISRDEGKKLRDMVAKIKPQRTLEVGMATGLSGLHICWGLAKAWGESVETPPQDGGEESWRHLAIDPFQKGDFWQGAGLQLKEQAGCGKIFKWTGDADDLALPKLLEKGQQVQFALIDGDHRFEAAMLDFYYVDKLLPVDGICVFDDTDWPSVWRVVQFALRHRSYEWVDDVMIDQGPITRPWSWKLRAHRRKTFRKQGWPVWEAIKRKPYQFVALRKVAENNRPEHFWENLE